MKKRKPRPRSNKLAVAVNRVSMTELDEKLSEWVSTARRTGPVVVDRYDTPWACIVAYGTWLEIDYLKSYVTNPNHPLVSLRESLDDAFVYAGETLEELTKKCESGVDARVIIRAWVLQVVYSVPCATLVREDLGHNMLWRWFLGYSRASEALPDLQAFVRDLRTVSANRQVVETVHQCLMDYVATHGAARGFCVNFGLLHALQEQFSTELKEPEKNSGQAAEGDLQQMQG